MGQPINIPNSTVLTGPCPSAPEFSEFRTPLYTGKQELGVCVADTGQAGKIKGQFTSSDPLGTIFQCGLGFTVAIHDYELHIFYMFTMLNVI